MVETSKRGARLNGNALVYMAMVFIGLGVILLVLLMAGCSSTSTITPATSSATRTTESKGPRTTLRVIVTTPKDEKRPNFEGANP